MLEGFDKDWVECGESNFTNYSNLSGDDYVFKVRATDRKGNWMESFAKPLLQTKNIAFDFSYDPALLQVNLSMEQRKNFYLVFKEAINNVLKYSVAGHLEVKIKTGNHKVNLTAK